MKKVRNKVFETNSSSSHSLILSKNIVKINEKDDDWDKARKYFGSFYDLYSQIDSFDWEQYKEDLENALELAKAKDPKYYKWEFYSELNERFNFDFSRGNPRVFDDFIHKTAFILAVNKYRDNEEDSITSKFIDKVIEKAEEHLRECKNYDKVKALIEVFLKWLFKNEDFIQEGLTSECSNYDSILYKIMEDEELIERFIFNEDSYIALGGDEYEGSYLRLVGTTNEYYDKYGSSNYMMEYEKRLNEVYPENEYNVYIEL